MKKRALQLASVASMIDQFNISNIRLLQLLGYQVDVVADFSNPGTITQEHCDDLMKRLSAMKVNIFDVAIPRTLNIFSIISAYRNVKKILNYNHYDLLHCHSPIGSVIARQAAKNFRKKGLKVIYTAHGFHFYKDAPIKNWIIFYPIEKYYSKYTDVLITINREDYKRALEKFHADKTIYIPGVGVDINRFSSLGNRRKRIRKELGISDKRIVILSVGELNKNKNHESVIRALERIDNVTYVLVGKGELKDYLSFVANKCGVDLRMVGFRTDVNDFYSASDIYILPSIREGLNVSLMEAMASSLACLASKIRGNVDLIDEGKGGGLFYPKDIGGIRKALKKIIYMSNEERYKLGQYNLDKIQSFDLKTVERITYNIYDAID